MSVRFWWLWVLVVLAPGVEAAARAETAVQPDIAIIEIFGVERPIVHMETRPVFRFDGSTFRTAWGAPSRFTLRGRVDGCTVSGSVEKSKDSRKFEYPLEGEYNGVTLDLWVIVPDEGVSIIYQRAIGGVYRFRFKGIAVGDGCGAPAVAIPEPAPGPVDVAAPPEPLGR